jgi:isochorismate synthase
MNAPFSVHRRRLGPAFDLLAAYEGPGSFFFERGGLGVATSSGRGAMGMSGPADAVGVRSWAAHALGEMRSIGGTDGPGAVAVGALRFDAGSFSLSIHGRTAFRRSPGETWLIDLVPEGGEPAPFEPSPQMGGAPRDPFEEVQLRPIPSPEDYATAVAAAVQRIQAGELRKVVLARFLDVHAGRELDPRRLSARLRAVDPDCYTFAVTDGDGPPPWATLVGASPELLVARDGREVVARPLAGSSPRYGDPGQDEDSRRSLLDSSKDREEHAAVVEAVAAALEPLCEELEHSPEPETIGTANVWHLATPFRGALREPSPTVVELVALLHPTPAVCGTPLERARLAIHELEPIPRGGYAGPVGWMDANGDGEWAIALRCAELRGSEALLYAGAGIVASSVPDLELEETERKFRAFLDSLRWG